jgi:dipeptidyl aminopeptidase/acylaminoacyl peptidase
VRPHYPDRLRALAETATPAAVHHVYGDDAQQWAELRLPDGRGPHPVAVLVHGGYWRALWHADLMNALAVDLCNRGLATWNLEYRRLGNPGGGVAARARLDLGRVLVVGHSAGGQLALWLAARHRLAAGLPGAGPRLRPRGVVSLAGVCDLVEAARQRLSDGAAVELLGGTPEEVPERYAAASPAELAPLGVPQVLVHGDDDDLVPVAMSRRQLQVATAAGDEARLLLIPGADHFDLIDPASAAWATTVDALSDLYL